MAARLQLILAHLSGIAAVGGVSADSVVAKLMNLGQSGPLAHETKLTINTPGMTEAVARDVVDKLAAAIRTSGNFAGPAFRAAYNRALDAAEKIEGFAKDHPVWTTVIALGMLAIMCPAVIHLLGFGLQGVTKGELLQQSISRQLRLTYAAASYAAAWQSTYRGLVPAKSLFAYLQHLGTVMVV